MELQYDGADRTQLREALAAYGLAPNKGLGQNFLCDARACDAIVSAAGGLVPVPCAGNRARARGADRTADSKG